MELPQVTNQPFVDGNSHGQTEHMTYIKEEKTICAVPQIVF